MSFLSRLYSHPLIQTIARVAQAQRVPVYLVGGAVRDALLGTEEAHDFDCALSNGFDQLVSAFAAEKYAKIIDWDSDQKRVVFRQGSARITVDFSRMTKPDIVDDLKQRDFTVNAMACALHLDDSPLIDPLGGRDDLTRRCLRMCSDGCFESDPLRMLRAIRFSRQLSCEIEPVTWESMLCNSALIIRSARERIKRELFTVLHEHDKGKSLRELQDSGLLAHLFPGLGMIERDHGNHSFESVSFEHCLRTVDFLDAVQFASDDLLDGVRHQLSDYVNQDLEEGVSMLSLLVLAAFLAYAAGSQCNGGAGHSLEYYGHEMSLTKTAQRIACETGLGRKAQHIVACLYAQRMRIAQMAQLETLPERVKVRFVLDCGEAAVGVCLLAIADSFARASSLELQSSSPRVTDIACDLCTWILSSQDVRDASPLLTGNDVISLLGIEAGPHIGNILSQAAQLERSGALQDRKAALLWLRNLPPSG